MAWLRALKGVPYDSTQNAGCPGRCVSRTLHLSPRLLPGPGEAELAGGGCGGLVRRLAPALRRVRRWRRPLLPPRGARGHPGNAAARLRVGDGRPDPSAHGFPSFQRSDAAAGGRADPATAGLRLLSGSSPQVPEPGPRFPPAAGLLVELAGPPSPAQVGWRLSPFPAPARSGAEPRAPGVAPAPSPPRPWPFSPPLPCPPHLSPSCTLFPRPSQGAPSSSWCPTPRRGSGRAVVLEVMNLPRESVARTCRSLTRPLSRGARARGWGALGL